MLTRRQFLGRGACGLSFVTLAGSMPGFLTRAAAGAEAAAKNDHVLVVVELSGGNDGLNTVIPFENDLYYKNRPTLGIAKDQVLKLGDAVGFHPSLAPLHELFQNGKLAVVQGVGYPRPDRSHFRSMEIWHTASTNTSVPTTGWLGRVVDHVADKPDEQLYGLVLSGGLPQAFQADKVAVPVVAQLEALPSAGEGAPTKAQVLKKLSTTSGSTVAPVDFLRSQAKAVYRAAEKLQNAAAKYQSSITYPEGELGPQLRRAAQILSADLGIRVLYATQGGYDTHAGQGPAHAALLDQLAQSLAAFQKDLDALKVADRVAVLVFSEFGRRVDENASQGTDHGAASNVFVLGGKVQGGLLGKHPSLAELGEGDLIFNTDFRSAYAALLDGWLGCPSEKLLGQKFDPLPLFG
jgi:uncharacterized protein (DUF1501 family)